MGTKKINLNNIVSHVHNNLNLNKFEETIIVKLDELLKLTKRQQKDIKTANKTISKITEENKTLKDYKGWYESKCKETLSNATLLEVLLEPYKRFKLFIKKTKCKIQSEAN